MFDILLHHYSYMFLCTIPPFPLIQLTLISFTLYGLLFPYHRYTLIQAIKARVMYLPNINDLPLLMSVLYIAHFSAMYVLKLKDNVELNKKSLV